MRISDWSSDVCSSDLFAQRGARRNGTTAYGTRQACGIEHRQRTNRFGHALQELRQYRARIATRTVDGIAANLAQQFTGIDCSATECAREHGPQGQRHIVAGVAIGDRKPVRSDEHTSELKSLMRI